MVVMVEWRWQLIGGGNGEGGDVGKGECGGGDQVVVAVVWRWWLSGGGG